MQKAIEVKRVVELVEESSKMYTPFYVFIPRYVTTFPTTVKKRTVAESYQLKPILKLNTPNWERFGVNNGKSSNY